MVVDLVDKVSLDSDDIRVKVLNEFGVFPNLSPLESLQLNSSFELVHKNVSMVFGNFNEVIRLRLKWQNDS